MTGIKLKHYTSIEVVIIYLLIIIRNSFPTFLYECNFLPNIHKGMKDIKQEEEEYH